jgi:hypothetical protein
MRKYSNSILNRFWVSWFEINFNYCFLIFLNSWISCEDLILIKAKSVQNNWNYFWFLGSKYLSIEHYSICLLWDRYLSKGRNHFTDSDITDRWLNPTKNFLRINYRSILERFNLSVKPLSVKSLSVKSFSVKWPTPELWTHINYIINITNEFLFFNR